MTPFISNSSFRIWFDFLPSFFFYLFYLMLNNITAVACGGDLSWVFPARLLASCTSELWLTSTHPTPALLKTHFQDVINAVVGCILIWQLHSLCRGLQHHLSYNLHRWKCPQAGEKQTYAQRVHRNAHSQFSSTNNKNFAFLLQGKLEGTSDALWLNRNVNLHFVFPRVSSVLIQLNVAPCGI